MYEEVKKELKKGICETFGDLLEYAFLSGRFAYDADNSNESDIDVIMVLKPTTENMDEKIRQKMIKKFVRTYLEIHYKNGYKPDLLFPGEFVTTKQINDSIRGRGYHIHNSHIHLPFVYTDNYWLTPENEYRAWRCMSAFNSRVLLCGNKEIFLTNRKLAWKEIIKFLVKDKAVITGYDILDEIINGDEGYLGISKMYEPQFSNSEYKTVVDAVHDLTLEGLLKYKEKESYLVVSDKVKEWEENLINRLKRKKWEGRHIVNWEDVRSFANEWVVLNGKTRGNKNNQI